MMCLAFWSLREGASFGLRDPLLLVCCQVPVQSSGDASKLFALNPVQPFLNSVVRS
jgi:hypothetical protein